MINKTPLTDFKCINDIMRWSKSTISMVHVFLLESPYGKHDDIQKTKITKK